MNDEKKRKRQEELTELLNKAARAYYQESREIMPNIEYDRLYDELLKIEEETGRVLSSSPTHMVGYEVLSELEKETHPQPMLSLDKTKDVEVLGNFLGDHKGVISWKLDGLTVVLTYEEGKLAKAVTRGNGVVGEVITNNAKVFDNVPLSIPFQGRLVLRGEAIIKYSDFNKINESLDVEAKYKNPRNLCSGSVRQLDNRITQKRHVNFIAFALIEAEGVDFKNSLMEEFAWLSHQGFAVVEHYLVGRNQIADQVHAFEKKIPDYDLPSDGLVVIFDDLAYGQSLGTTAKYPRNGLAFKWRDELKTTKLLKVEWSLGRTGLITPVAVFEPVELEGTTVSRASIHNVSLVKELELGIGDEISVYKANMIIPQIEENFTRSGNLEIPKICPVCGGSTTISNENGTETLICTNPACTAKHVKRFAHYVSRNAANVDGLSEETLLKLIDHGCLKNLWDLYHLQEHRDLIMLLEGFGKKSYTKLIEAIEGSRQIDPANFLYALGINNVGLSNARMVLQNYNGNLDAIAEADKEELAKIYGVGDVIAKSIYEYFHEEKSREEFEKLRKEITLNQVEMIKGSSLEGKTFVITGSVHHFANRDELKEKILSLGGKASGSVSSKTSYLINNDNTSTSGKNKKAKELGIPIITEDEFFAMIQEGED